MTTNLHPRIEELTLENADAEAAIVSQSSARITELEAEVAVPAP